MNDAVQSFLKRVESKATEGANLRKVPCVPACQPACPYMLFVCLIVIACLVKLLSHFPVLVHALYVQVHRQKIATSLGTIVLFLLLGTLFYKYNEGWTFVESLFWTFSTVMVSHPAPPLPPLTPDTYAVLRPLFTCCLCCVCACRRWAMEIRGCSTTPPGECPLLHRCACLILSLSCPQLFCLFPCGVSTECFLSSISS